MRFLLILFALIIVSSLPIHAQMWLQSTGSFSEIKDGKYERVKLIYENDSLYYVFQERYYHTNPVLNIISKSDLSVLEQIEDPFDLEQSDLTYEEIIQLGSKAYICYSNKTGEGEYDLMLKELSPEWMDYQPSVVIHKMKTIPKGNLRYKIFKDELGNYFGIQEIFELREGVIRERLLVINKDMEKVFEQIYLPQEMGKLNFFKNHPRFGLHPKPSFNFSRASFDEHGNIYVGGFNGLLIYQKNHQYQLTEYSFPSFGLGPSQRIGFANFVIRGSDILLTAEFYENNDLKNDKESLTKGLINDTNTIGYFSMIISKSDFDIQKIDIHYLEKDERAPISASSEFWSLGGTSVVTLRHTESVVLPDSSVLLISERYGNNLWLKTRLLTGTISLIKYSKEGDFEWIKYIDKIGSARGNVTPDGYTTPISFQYTLIDGKLYFFYNTTTKPSEPYLRKTKDFIDAELVIVELNPADGSIRKDSQGMFIDGEYVFYPLGIGDTRFEAKLLLLSKGKHQDFKIGTYELELE